MNAARYACPQCGGTVLGVTVTATMKLQQDANGNLQTIDEGGGHEWDNSSTMWCEDADCRHSGVAASFENGTKGAA